METHIECKDFITIRKGKGKNIVEDSFRVEVDIEGEDERIWFRSNSGVLFGSVSIPVEYWDALKGTVDRLIIKAENLAKEDC